MTALDILAKRINLNTIYSRDGDFVVQDEKSGFIVGINPFLRSIEEAYKLGAEEALRQADSITWIHGDSVSSLKGTIKLDEL